MKIFELFGEVFIDDKATKELLEITKKSKVFGFEIDGNIKKFAGFAAAGVGGAVAVGAGMLKLANDAADASSRINDMSAKIGISTTAFQEWDYVLKQNGVDIGVMQGGMKTLNNAIDEATKGGEKQTAAFKTLGISITDNNGKLKSSEQLFNETVTALQGMEEGANKSALASDLLGKSSTEMGAILNGTTDDVNKLKERANELGIVLSEDAIKAGDDFGDMMEDFNLTTKALTNELGTALMPAIQGFVKYLLSHVDDIKSWAENFVYGFNQIRIGLLSLEKGFFDVFINLDKVVNEFVLSMIEKVVSGINGMTDIFGGFIDKINKTFGINLGKPTFEKFGKDMVDGFRAGMGTGIVSDFKAMSDVIAGDIADIENGVSRAGKNIAKSAETTTRSIGENVEAVKEITIGAMATCEDYATKAMAQLDRLLEYSKTEAQKNREENELAAKNLQNFLAGVTSENADNLTKFYAEDEKAQKFLEENKKKTAIEALKEITDTRSKATKIYKEQYQKELDDYQKSIIESATADVNLTQKTEAAKMDIVRGYSEAARNQFSETVRVGISSTEKVMMLLNNMMKGGYDLTDYINATHKMNMEDLDNLRAAGRAIQKTGMDWDIGGRGAKNTNININVNKSNASAKDIAKELKYVNNQFVYV